MEHISQVLKELDRGTPIPSPEISIPEAKPEDRLEELRQNLGVSSLTNTFENFKLIPGAEDSYRYFKELADGKTDKRMLLCYGWTGCGKTYLCEAAVIALYKRGIFCRICNFPRAIRSLREAKVKSLEFYNKILDRYCTMGHLIFDDVGMGMSLREKDWETDLALGILEEIVVARYQSRLFTMMTTNWDITELPVRIVSRFSDKTIGYVVYNEADDYRQRNQPPEKKSK